ncbi:MAG: hypothetical protein ACW977_13600, partial [Candidatus Thorarchaeota archaeon]
MPEDRDRKQYGVFQGKLGMLFGLATTASLIPGSVLALAYGREWVFQIQAIMCLVLVLVVLRIIKDLPEVIERRKEEEGGQNYLELFKEGFNFVASDRFLALLFLGQILIFSVITVYG